MRQTTTLSNVALGKPGRIREHATNEGTRTVWIYTAYHEEYEGPHVVGSHTISLSNI